MGTPSLLDALDYLALLAEFKPERFPRAAVRWRGRLELDAPTLTPTHALLGIAPAGPLERGRDRPPLRPLVAKGLEAGSQAASQRFQVLRPRTQSVRSSRPS